jgi:hypothetical protein
VRRVSLLLCSALAMLGSAPSHAQSTPGNAEPTQIPPPLLVTVHEHVLDIRNVSTKCVFGFVLTITRTTPEGRTIEQVLRYALPKGRDGAFTCLRPGRTLHRDTPVLQCQPCAGNRADADAGAVQRVDVDFVLFSDGSGWGPGRWSQEKERLVGQFGVGLTIHLAKVQGGPKAPRFRVDFQNTGRDDLMLNLGMMLANGSRQYPDAVTLTLTDAQGKSRRLDLIDPSFVSGRIDPFVVPLPVGASFSIPVDLDKYSPANPADFDYKLRPGSYSLLARFNGKGVTQQQANLDMKGIALMPYWEGTATSNQLRFAIPSQ